MKNHIKAAALTLFLMATNGAFAQGGVGNGGDVVVGARFFDIANHLRNLFNRTEFKKIVGEQHSLDELVDHLQVRRTDEVFEGSFKNKIIQGKKYTIVRTVYWEKMGCKSRSYLVLRSLLQHLGQDTGAAYAKTERAFQYLNSKSLFLCDGVAPSDEEIAEQFSDPAVRFSHIAEKIRLLEFTYDFGSVIEKLQVFANHFYLQSSDGYPVDALSSSVSGVPHTRVAPTLWGQKTCEDQFFLTLHELLVHLNVEQNLGPYTISQPMIRKWKAQGLISCDSNHTLKFLSNGTKAFKANQAVILRGRYYVAEIPGLEFDEAKMLKLLEQGKEIMTSIPMRMSTESINSLLMQAGLGSSDQYEEVFLDLDDSLYAKAAYYRYYLCFTRSADGSLVDDGFWEPCTGAAAERASTDGTKNHLIGHLISGRSGPLTLEIAAQRKLGARVSPGKVGPYATDWKKVTVNTHPVDIPVVTSLTLSSNQISKIRVTRINTPVQRKELEIFCKNHASASPLITYICSKNTRENEEIMSTRYRVRIYFVDQLGKSRYMTYSNAAVYPSFHFSADGGASYPILQGTEKDWDRWIHGNDVIDLIDQLRNRNLEMATFKIDPRMQFGFENDSQDQDEMLGASVSVNSTFWTPEN